ncbi:MAG: FAD-dependent oxidoreductase [Acidobacteriota bacterium]
MTARQVTARDAVARTWDVAIVGGGPAGAMAALHLARAGRSVVILERESYPREKVCGDALIPDSIRVLGRAGVLREVQGRALETTSLRLFRAII